MTQWFRSYIKSAKSLFFNHSGLTSGSFSTAGDFRKFLIKKEVRKKLLPFLKSIPIYTAEGKKKAAAERKRAVASAKNQRKAAKVKKQRAQSKRIEEGYKKFDADRKARSRAAARNKRNKKT